ncbi:MAG: hypothetical protein FJW37_03665 [Acidobacteria bacterium]|nr:hypothetical protein [Acidobacteriota bacterium]
MLAGSSAIVEPASPVDKPSLISAFMQQKLALWQKRLRLQDWKIQVKVVRKSELKPKTLGNVHWDLTTKSAVIRAMHFDDYARDFTEVLEELEVTIVHELIHLHLASLPRNEASRSAEEQAVNTIVEALISLDRNKK